MMEGYLLPGLLVAAILGGAVLLHEFFCRKRAARQLETQEAERRRFLELFEKVIGQKPQDLAHAGVLLGELADEIRAVSRSARSDAGSASSETASGNDAPVPLLFRMAGRGAAHLEAELAVLRVKAEANGLVARLDRQLDLFANLSMSVRLAGRLLPDESGAGDPEDIRLCFREGGFDFAICLPPVLDAYYRDDAQLKDLMRFCEQLRMAVSLIGDEAGISFFTIPPLTRVRQNDPRITFNDQRGVKSLPNVDDAVQRALAGAGSGECLVVDCPIPAIRLDGKPFRNMQLVAYNHSDWA